MDKNQAGMCLIVGALLLVLTNTVDPPMWLDIVFRVVAFGCLIAAFQWWRRNRNST